MMAERQPPALVLSVYHGLGNRLRTVAAAAALSEELGRELHIYWPINAQVITID